MLTSTFGGQSEVNLTLIVVAEIDLAGSDCGPFAIAPRLLGTGLVDVGWSIMAVDLLDEALQALQQARDGNSLKVMLRP